jgi:hypothetical protein
MMTTRFLLLIVYVVAGPGGVKPGHAQPPQPRTLIPKLPAPHWPTDHLPIALHAANETGMYSAAAVRQLAKYDMVTIEKCVAPETSSVTMLATLLC